ncbi:MAG: protein kinase, partial [Actinomycetota bacterium]
AAEIADALQAAHDAGVIHRDVKPGNVMLEAGGRVRVLDFGIAAAAWAAPITASGTTLGTASYLSPEQASGRRVTPASDVYSLGCVLFEMLTGRPPFTGESAVAVAAAHARQAPPPVEELTSDVPAGLAATCQRSLAKEPASRFASAADFAAALRELTTGAGATAPMAAAEDTGATKVLTAPDATAVLPPAERVEPVAGERRPVRPPWLWLAAAALAALAGLILLLVSVLAGPDDRQPANRPTAPADESPQSPPQPTAATIPSVVGLRLGDAVDQLTDAGFVRVRVVNAEEGDPGIVVAVEPSEGATVSLDQTVTLFVGPPDENRGEGNGKGKGRPGKGKDH